jgi:hypothetical protein
MPAVIRQQKIIAIDKDGGTWRVTYRIFEKNYYLESGIREDSEHTGIRRDSDRPVSKKETKMSCQVEGASFLIMVRGERRPPVFRHGFCDGIDFW